MILNDEVKIIGNPNNISYYKYLGYNIKYNSEIMVKVSDLSKSSRAIITAICFYCESTKEISYRNYNINTKSINKFTCSSKCRNVRNKELSLDKYGVEHYSQTTEYKEKIKKTNLEKYGNESYSKTNEYKEKVKITNIERYGKTSYNKTDEFKKRVKNTCLDKYGVDSYTKTDEYLKKSKETCLDKYGVDSYTKTDEYLKKSKETCLDKYGVEHILQSNYYKEKFKLSIINKYGVDSYTKTDEYLKKSKETCLDKYGVDSYTKSENYHLITIIGNHKNYLKYLNNGISLFKCDDTDHYFELSNDNFVNRSKNNIPLCTICNPIGDSRSIKEKILFEFIKESYNGKIIQSYRDKLEIDIFLPELNIGFEFNGLYWHSERFKEKNYHLNKTNYFKEKDIRIIHIWEDDWTFKQDIVKSQILNLIAQSKKIYARKCLAKEVNVKETRMFLDNNHIQGFISSSKKIGLYYENELVSIMTFDHNEGRKKMKNNEWNLSRFCNKAGYNIIGGASKLLNNFIKNNEVYRIISYADKDWSIGSLYYTLGFENIGGNGPDYKYIVDGKRVHKSRYKKSKLNTNLTESEKMKELNINKIYDCGKIKFEKII